MMSEPLSLRLLSEVFARLPIADLCSSACTCLHWSKSFQQDDLWQNILQQHYGPSDLNDHASTKAACLKFASMEMMLIRHGISPLLAWATSADLSSVLDRFARHQDIAAIRFMVLPPSEPGDHMVADKWLKYSQDVHCSPHLRDGYTLLHVAGANARHDRTVQSLLHYSCDVHLCTGNGWSPLHAAARFGTSTTVLKALLEDAADINGLAQCAMGTCTPLLDACCGVHGDNAAMVQMLIDFHADLNACWACGESALCTAIENDRPAIGAALVAAGSQCSNPMGTPAAGWDFVKMALSRSRQPHLWMQVFLGGRLTCTPSQMFCMVASREELPEEANIRIIALLQKTVPESEERAVAHEVLCEAIRRANTQLVQALCDCDVLMDLVQEPCFHELAKDTCFIHENSLQHILTSVEENAPSSGAERILRNFMEQHVDAARRSLQRSRLVVDILAAKSSSWLHLDTTVA